MFPVEILEIFFKQIDGVDIINCRLVCKTWNSIITRLSKDTNFWQMKCQNEIPINCRRAIADKLYPKIKSLDSLQSDNYLKWLSLYKCWMKWHRINEFEIFVEQFEPFFIHLPSVQITCIIVSENLLAVGSSAGFIAIYNVDSSIMEPIFIADQMDSVSDVKFLKQDKRTAVITSSVIHRIMLWDVQLKKRIGKREYGILISTTYEHIWITMMYTLIVRDKKRARNYDFPVLQGVIVAVVADGYQGFLLTNLGYSYAVNINDPTDPCVESYIEPPIAIVNKYYLFWPRIAICITENGFLGTSINCGDWVMHEILSKLHGTPTAVLFYANILVLGLDSGSVHVYYVKNMESLATWDFKSENSKIIIIDNQAVIGLDIMDRPNKQFLIAATTQKVTVIELQIPKN